MLFPLWHLSGVERTLAVHSSERQHLRTFMSVLKSSRVFLVYPTVFIELPQGNGKTAAPVRQETQSTKLCLRASVSGDGDKPASCAASCVNPRLELEQELLGLWLQAMTRKVFQ